MVGRISVNMRQERKRDRGKRRCENQFFFYVFTLAFTNFNFPS